MNGQASVDLLVFSAHPDDAEIGMGGTIAKHTRHGHTVVLCDLTLAELSSNGDVETRQREASVANQVLGVRERVNLKLPDRGLQVVKESIDAVVDVLRRFRPRVVAAPYWQDRHPDHIACSKLVQEALFNAKLRKYKPDLAAWLVPQVYYYFINDVYEPDMIVDTTEVHATKMAGLQAYRSQFDAPGKGEDRVVTPLTDSYLERVDARDRLLGVRAKVGYAEGFVSREPLLVTRLGGGSL